MKIERYTYPETFVISPKGIATQIFNTTEWYRAVFKLMKSGRKGYTFTREGKVHEFQNTLGHFTPQWKFNDLEFNAAVDVMRLRNKRSKK